MSISPTQRKHHIYTSVVNISAQKLETCLRQADVPHEAGIGHSKKVLGHMMQALEPRNSKIDITQERKLSLLLGALLHRADDPKYFPKDSQNAFRIIEEALSLCDPDCFLKNHVAIISDALMIIDYVSFSRNGNRVPEIAKDCPEVLWVRFCDRLESIGMDRILGVYQYAMQKGQPLQIKGQTPRPQSEKEMWSYVTEERFESYQ